MDDGPTGQPALALAQKVIERVTQVGLPADLIPATMTSVTVSADVDAENSLRTSVLEFMDTVRRTEHAIAAGRRGEDVPEELDVALLGDISEEEWRAYWPAEVEPEVEALPDEAQAEDTEPAPDRIPEPTPAEVPEPGPVEVPEPSPVLDPVPEEPGVPEPPPEDVSTEEPTATEESDDGGESSQKFTA
jgi:XTP/dITP diphosphohydrolase